MLTTLLLTLIFTPVLFLINLILSIIPQNAVFSSTLSTIIPAFQWFFGLINFFNPIIPSLTIKGIMATFFAYYVCLFYFRFGSWVLRKIPFLGIS